MNRLVVALLLIVCSTTVFAQRFDEYGIPVNSLNVQVSDGLDEIICEGLISAIGPVAEATTSAIIAGMLGTEPGETTKWKHGMPTPYMTIGYEHHFPGSRWNLGGEAGYWCRTSTTLNKEPNITQHFNFASAVVTSKLFYKPSGVCKLYGGLNIGAITFFTSNSSGLPVIPAVQFNPIGMRLGGEKIAFMAELGFGYRGFLQMGANIAL